MPLIAPPSVSTSTSSPFYATESGGTWGPGTEVPGAGGGGGYFQGVSCTDASDCTAVGVTKRPPMYATESGGTWGRPPRSRRRWWLWLLLRRELHRRHRLHRRRQR